MSLPPSTVNTPTANVAANSRLNKVRRRFSWTDDDNFAPFEDNQRHERNEFRQRKRAAMADFSNCSKQILAELNHYLQMKENLLLTRSNLIFSFKRFELDLLHQTNCLHLLRYSNREHLTIRIKLNKTQEKTESLKNEIQTASEQITAIETKIKELTSLRNDMCEILDDIENNFC